VQDWGQFDALLNGAINLVLGATRMSGPPREIGQSIAFRQAWQALAPPTLYLEWKPILLRRARQVCPPTQAARLHPRNSCFLRPTYVPIERAPTFSLEAVLKKG